jgi:hypothetical protein
MPEISRFWFAFLKGCYYSFHCIVDLLKRSWYKHRSMIKGMMKDIGIS